MIAVVLQIIQIFTKIGEDQRRIRVPNFVNQAINRTKIVGQIYQNDKLALKSILTEHWLDIAKIE